MITDREKILAIVDNDCLRHSDAAILLEGDGFFRFQKAIDLYKTGQVDRIIFSGNIIDKDYGSFPYDEVAPLILKQGVPEKDLIHEAKSRHTREQALEVINMAMENGWTKLALVASHEHQYRAYLTFLRVVLDTGSGIILYNSPVRNLNWFVDSGWGMRFERLAAEIERIEKYSELGHLATADEVIEYQKWKESLLDL
ncbi:MAG: YdcF family protein [Bacteroidales bacterium]|nr:YdcF family protein [Bacteroidales bacterium]